MYCTAPLRPRKGRLISFHDDDDDDDDDDTVPWQIKAYNKTGLGIYYCSL